MFEQSNSYRCSQALLDGCTRQLPIGCINQFCG
ncbi:Uncharacterised protein [Vibrio cholerae]|nr:Uncharacterised protein [Vibrio cholerae]